ncbi:hypothetical protein DLAC_06860 [Tieghemostelium lacteum]|uniref:Uncharacterized protein n=1 Tax=Tieghemostelium lacteum TaxID=361077 RepID=A0A151ZDL9_TIELA|nr:hypothetical protein DLAC_06860 [Tieghemostelium lacteum]|eukprot:KYQ92031.1 hypothetical protein DLAC_06860 [Tieghemostelium lacteum]
MTNTRNDGRLNNQIRAFESEQSLLNKADGSARFTQNKSSVLAAVYGPIEVKNSRKQKILKSLIEVSFTPSVGNTTYLDKEKELLIKNALESIILTTLHPRTQISIIFQVFSDDGSIISCAINAACLALLDAGIEMQGLIGSVTLCYNHDKSIYLDPTAQEEKECKSLSVIAYGSQSSQIIMNKTEGTLSMDLYFKSLPLSKEACDKVISYIKLAVKNRIMGTISTNTTSTTIES